jgi:hypothetical protein
MIPMKPRLACLTIVASCLILATGCSKQDEGGGRPGGKIDRVITVQAGGTLGCEVDYPVAVMYIAKHYPRWISNDNEYWIHFVGVSPFSVDPIDVPTHGKSRQLDITGPPNYYKYEIWSQPDSASTPHKICKGADDDHDTGLNVKR